MNKPYLYKDENIVEVREASTPKETNRLLEDGWKLLRVLCDRFLLARYELR